MTSEIERLKRENLHLRCVMLEAAKELSQYWELHTGEGGLGPIRLQEYLTLKSQVRDVENPYPQNEDAAKNA